MLETGVAELVIVLEKTPKKRKEKSSFECLYSFFSKFLCNRVSGMATLYANSSKSTAILFVRVFTFITL